MSNYDLNVDATSRNDYMIYVEDSVEFESLAKFISELDSILSYSFHNDNIPSGMSEYKAEALMIQIYMGDTFITDIYLSSDDNERLDSEQVYTDIDENYVDCIKAGKLDDSITMELWNSYPAKRIDSVYLNGELLSTEYGDLYTLYYQKDLDTYLMSRMDPCQDFEDFPYNYLSEGTYANMVQLLGGTYSCDDWKAIWTINDVTWEATLHTKKKYYYKYFEVSRNGVEIEMSDGDIWEKNNSVSGRSYTVEDLEQMLL